MLQRQLSGSDDFKGRYQGSSPSNGHQGNINRLDMLGGKGTDLSQMCWGVFYKQILVKTTMSLGHG